MRDWATRALPAAGAALALLGTAGAGFAPVRARPAAQPAWLARSGSAVVPVPRLTFPAPPGAAPTRLNQADLLVVAPSSLPARTARLIRRLAGVTAAQRLDAARIKVNGKFVAMLGVDPQAFRAFAPRPTADSARLWQGVADGGIAISYTMGRLDKLPLGGTVRVTGRRWASLRVDGFGTVGIGGVDAVVSHATARSLGLPAANAIVISAPHARLGELQARIKNLLPRRAAVELLVASPATGSGLSPGTAGGTGISAGGPGLSRTQLTIMLKAALSRVGLPYVWGAAGPRAFDCSGLVQWAYAQAGVTMPRVAADQARAGPAIPLRDAQPGDLIFYHTDPTAPSYISHVAIYLGNGLMLQAPEPGLTVQMVRADVGTGFAGIVRVYPRVAAVVAAAPVG